MPRAATKARTARKPAPEPEEELPDLSHYVEKAPTTTVENYFNWIAERTGYDEDEGLDLTSVKLAGTLRAQFQKETSTERGTARTARQAEPEPEEDEDEEEVEEAPPPKRATRAKAAPAKATAAAKRPARSRKVAADSPF